MKLSPRALRHLFNLYPPFAAAGVSVREISPDWRRVRVRLSCRPWNRNWVGTHFGGSLFAMTDPFWMIMLMENLGRDYLVWDRAGEIRFHAAVREPVYCEFQLTDAVLDELRAAAADGDKVLRWFDCPVTTADGRLVAAVRKQVYVRLKSRVRGNTAPPSA
jgi:acyl-coenzyme A thioesterase PaaI-like protein